MAKILSYTDATGTTFADCYWRLSLIYIDVAGAILNFTFYAYADSEKRTENKKPIAGAARSYEVRGADFAALMALNYAGQNVSQIIYGYLPSVKDTQVGVDANGNPIMDSFFANATDG